MVEAYDKWRRWADEKVGKSYDYIDDHIDDHIDNYTDDHSDDHIQS